ncbi:alpha/beta hydrolase [Leisingera caerulea]|uniref:alpha/beta hydrolase n=1 Tax=Leisingera caerulea TaxID=506591 RepID=UPI003F4A8CFD
MANNWHIKWLKEGVQRWNKRRKRIPFKPDLSGLNFFDVLPPDFRDDPKTSRYFEKIDLRDANLVGADLSRLNFFKAKFDNAHLSQADLTRSNFEKATFKKADLSGVSFEHSILNETEFDGTSLDGASFEGVQAGKVLAIATSLTAVQRIQLGPKNLREYTSRKEYQTERRMLRSRVTDQVGIATASQDDRPKKNAYEVFFGTTRNPVIQRGAVTGYGTEQWPSINYGIAKVVVPEGNRLGGIGKTLWRRLFNKQKSDLRLSEIMTLNPELFFSVLREVSSSGGQKQRPTVFVHGYNTSFEGAVLRAAQFGHDLGIAQGIGLFSWPSKGTEIGYSADEASAERNRYVLSEFLEQFVQAFPEQGISVVAHSMGCRCLLGALEVLAARNPPAAKSVHQVILAAADVDAAMMPHQGKFAVSNADRATSYVGDRDRALKLSKWLHGYDRVGLVPPAFSMPGLDTVLVNDTELGSLAHGYIGRSRAVLADVHALLTRNDPPETRFSIRAHLVGGIQVWKLAD